MAPPSRTRSRRRAWIVFLLVVVVCVNVAPARAEGLKGRLLTDVLKEFEGLLPITFTSGLGGLVQPEWIVMAEPRGDSPEKVLQEILAPYRLMAQRNPKGTWLVVLQEDRPAPTPAPEPVIPPSRPPPIFEVDAVAVPLNVLVTHEGRSVSGLTAADFDVRDNGVPQDVEMVTGVATETANVHVVLALDRSDSVGGAPLAELKSAAIDFVGALQPNDTISLVSFADGIDLWLPEQSSRESLTRVIRATKAEGTTALYDAAYVATKIAVGGEARSLVLVLSDGNDVGSWLKASDVLDVVREANIMVYAIEKRTNERPSAFLHDLVDASGGAVWRLGQEGDLAELLARAVAEARAMYRLRYIPRNVPRAGTHAIEVKLKSAPGTVQARRSYIAPRSNDIASLPVLDAVTVPSSGPTDAPIPHDVVLPASTLTAGSITSYTAALCQSRQSEPDSILYKDILKKYLDGDVQDAAQALDGCTPQQIRSLARYTRGERSLLPVIVSLQAQFALRGGAREGIFAWHLDLAREIAEEGLDKLGAQDRAAQETFWRSWLMALGRHYQAEPRLGAAHSLYETALRVYPDDPVAWLAAGTIFEAVFLLGGPTAAGLLVAPEDSRGEAEKCYRKALELDPSFVEAHLRLGRVLARAGHLADAAHHLDWVTRHGEDPFHIAFAWLFLGDIGEARGDLSQAVRNYRLALAAEPALQTALIALSHAIHRVGSPGLSREVLASVLPASRERSPSLSCEYLRGMGRGFLRDPAALPAALERARELLGRQTEANLWVKTPER